MATAHFTLFVENGRIRGRMLERTARHRRAWRRPLHHDAEPEFDHRRYSCRIERGKVEALLAEHRLDRPVSGLRRSAMACVALPTCGLALAESERYLPDLITAWKMKWSASDYVMKKSPSA